jgi:hypothetical protein
MKSNSNDKKHIAAKSGNHKGGHKADPKAEHKVDHKADKHHAGKHPAEKLAPEKARAEPQKAGKGGKKSGRAVAVPAGGGMHPAEQVKATRLAMIKARHESMKREIDQIREDLESDEDE